jgi:hypothetical protein
LFVAESVAGEKARKEIRTKPLKGIKKYFFIRFMPGFLLNYY